MVYLLYHSSVIIPSRSDISPRTR